MQQITDRYIVPAPPPEGWALNLGRYAPAEGLALASRLLYNRGFDDDRSAIAFLESDVTDLCDPFDLPQMDAAVKAILAAVDRGQRITVFGDFDADGITATSVLILALRKLGVECGYYLPTRETEGHGMSVEAVRQLREDGTDLLVTVDTGTTAHSAVSAARDAGMEVVITDHHIPGDTLPPAAAVVNPHLADLGDEMTDYCGAGIAFKLASAFLSRAGVDDYDDLIPLAAVGTIADRTQLLGDNRAIVKAGLKELDGNAPPGLVALVRLCMSKSRGNREIDAEFIGFQVAPRLNAPGRLGSANISVDLLTCPDYAKATRLAAEIDSKNDERRTLARKAMQDVDHQIEAAVDERRRVVLVGLDHRYPLGMLGPLAGTVNDYTGRPAIAYMANGDLIKASARSRGDFDIYDALNGISDRLVRFGGHSAAAGFQFRAEDLSEISDHLDRRVGWHEIQSGASPTVNGAGEPIRGADAEVELDRIGNAMWTFVKRLAPFGSGNEEPLFIIKRADVLESAAVGATGKQLRARFADETGRTTKAFGWGLGHLAPLPPLVDAVVSLRENHYNGWTTRELHLHDVAPSRYD